MIFRWKYSHPEYIAGSMCVGEAGDDKSCNPKLPVVANDRSVGMKDRRIDTIFHKRFRSPILHPYEPTNQILHGGNVILMMWFIHFHRPLSKSGW